MSFINDLLEKITGLDLDGSDSKETAVVERPCANCPSNCAIAGNACSVCQPYKKKLIDAAAPIAGQIQQIPISVNTAAASSLKLRPHPERSRSVQPVRSRIRSWKRRTSSGNATAL